MLVWRTRFAQGCARCTKPTCIVCLQHIFKHICKYRQDSQDESELTVGTLNAKLNDLSSTSDKVRTASSRIERAQGFSPLLSEQRASDDLVAHRAWM